jgi:hypothetical protein
MKGGIMDSKVGTFVMTLIVAAILWLVGGFVFGKAVGMICVLIGITIVGLAAGNIMNSPEPDNKQ